MGWWSGVHKVILYVICYCVTGKPSVLFLIRARYQLLLRRHSLGAGRHPPLDAAVQLNVWSVRRSRPSVCSFSDVALDAEPGAEGLERSTLGSTTAKNVHEAALEGRRQGQGVRARRGGGDGSGRGQGLGLCRRQGAFDLSSAKSCCKEEGAGASESRWRDGGGIECGGGGGE